MDKTLAYDKQIRSLKEECRKLSATRDPRALPALSRLGKIAEGMGDPALSGFVYFHTANYHYISSDYDAFHKNLGFAIRSLLRSEDYELLGRVYNFFAIEAYGKGVLDVAYNYYMSALGFMENRTESATKGFVFINLAGLFSRLAYYQEARRYFKKGFSLIKKNRKDLFYHRNMIAALIIDGLNSLAMGDTGAAKSAFRDATEIYNSADEALIVETRMVYAIFEIRLAICMHEKKKVRIQTAALAKTLAKEVLMESMDDICDFGRILIDEGYLREAAMIIDVVDERVMSSNVIHAMFQFTAMKVDYYEKTGDEKKLMKSLTEQNRLFLLSQRERQELYHYSIEYVGLVNELKEDEERIRRENEVLQEQAYNDALCGIPNRYAMDREMERAFERAYNSRTTLGIGIVDVNRFKEINDTFGHQTGDKYLAMIGEELRRFADEEHVFCARYGGDEFLIIYEGMRDEEIRKKALDMGRAISKRKVIGKGKAKGTGVSISQGVCNDIPHSITRPWDYLSAADAALYEVKKRSGSGDNVTLCKLPDKSGRRR